MHEELSMYVCWFRTRLVEYFKKFKPDEEVEYEYKEKDREDPPGVDIDLFDLGEAVALVLLLLGGEHFIKLLSSPSPSPSPKY